MKTTHRQQPAVTLASPLPKRIKLLKQRFDSRLRGMEKFDACGILVNDLQHAQGDVDRLLRRATGQP